MRTVTVLAKRFSELVRSELSGHLDEVVSKNDTEEYKNSCATHDYCDANELMAEAFQNIIGKECDVRNKRDTKLWDDAWGLAKNNDFYILEDQLTRSIRKNQIGTL